MLPEQINQCIEAFNALPGIGNKLAQRIVFYLLRSGKEKNLQDKISNLRTNIVRCQKCRNYSNQQLCSICLDPSRQANTILVISSPLDLIAFERTQSYHGLYHVLHGEIKPIDGMGPEDLEIQSLFDRIHQGNIEEVILCTNPNTEGETTAIYLRQGISKINPNIKITRLAHGLPMGAELEFADTMTLKRSLNDRVKL
jgi:recombination protein RecR